MNVQQVLASPRKTLWWGVARRVSALPVYQALTARGRTIVQRVERRLSKPPLAYLELHVTDHCNMNCSGCGHFSNVAPDWYADPASHDRDMRRLSQLFANVVTLHLLGGEPLLHERITDFLSSSRRWLPLSDIRLVTNGILLPKMRQDFWETCRANRIGIDISLYPPMAKKADHLKRLVTGEKVDLIIKPTTTFFASLNPKGDSDPATAMRACRKMYYTPFLKEGRVYLCPFSPNVPIYNQVFSAALPEKSGAMDIHSRRLTGWDVLEFLERPADVCRFCSYGVGVRNFAWKRTTGTKEDYNFEVSPGPS